MSPPPSTTTPLPSRLFTPLRLNDDLTLSNRIVMAPLTRFRSSDAHVPLLPMVATYYSQRARYAGSLLISEATYISPKAAGYPNAPGIWNAAQIEAWQAVTEAVHSAGSSIFCQLWAMGRTANAYCLSATAAAEGAAYDVVSSSATPLQSGDAPASPPPRALTLDEIPVWVADYAAAARNAMAAGFDGVEIHAANGYLPDQFTQDVCNTRTDEYGGSVEKRARFTIEITRAVVDAIGPHRTAIRLSPFSRFQDMRMADPVPQFTYLAEQLGALRLAYVHVIVAEVDVTAEQYRREDNCEWLFKAWEKGAAGSSSSGGGAGAVLVAGGYTPETARKAADEEYTARDVGVVFGRHYISNPDLVWRVEHGVALTKYNRATFYTPKSEEGYIDYPTFEEAEKPKQEAAEATENSKI